MPASGGTHGTTEHLSTYLRQWMAERDESERGLARRARDPETGLALRHGWINQLVLGQVTRAPELWRLRALAVAIGVPVRKLAELAAAQYLGIATAEITVSEEETIVVSVPPGITQEDRERLVRIVEDVARHMGS